jgi:glycosyltransferase involved in cell wall biosynthesis
MPAISVMIPAFNRAHLIGKTIESVVRQDFDDWELTVVDDASSDGTADVVRQYCSDNGRIRLVLNDCNLGLTGNWNRCLELAHGPLVQILQSDDLIDRDYLKIASRFLARNPDVGFVAASCRYIGPDDQVIHAGHSRSAQTYAAGDEAVTALLAGGWPHVSSIIMRRECYDTLGGFDDRIWHGPDGEMFTRFASRYDFHHFGAVHTSFRRHGSNMGVLEYLRPDFLDVDMMKKRETWSYLSRRGREDLGVTDLARFIAKDGARSALTGATVTIAYGRPDLARYYMRRAVTLDRKVARQVRFWKVVALLLAGRAGRHVMRRRLQVRNLDTAIVGKIAESLDHLDARKPAR